jgi:phosphomannomutase
LVFRALASTLSLNFSSYITIGHVSCMTRYTQPEELNKIFLEIAPQADLLVPFSAEPPESGWFAARPSRTENIYKIYAESFKSQTHLNAILSEAAEMVNNALGSSAVVPEQGGRT